MVIIVFVYFVPYRISSVKLNSGSAFWKLCFELFFSDFFEVNPLTCYAFAPYPSIYYGTTLCPVSGFEVECPCLCRSFLIFHLAEVVNLATLELDWFRIYIVLAFSGFIINDLEGESISECAWDTRHIVSLSVYEIAFNFNVIVCFINICFINAGGSDIIVYSVEIEIT